MKRTKIEWCDRTWNPVTGCLHHCEYCYAAGIARRFGGALPMQEAKYIGECVELNHPLLRTTRKGRTAIAAYPYGFLPTFHRYKLDEPQKVSSHANVFVCSMADLFGAWVPTRWIRDVLDVCAAAPQHRFLFLSKNPGRYEELEHIALLPHENRYWYGLSVTNQKDAIRSTEYRLPDNLFWSVEPLHGEIRIHDLCTSPRQFPKWVIVGAETGNRKEIIVPKRRWVVRIAEDCAEMKIPVFYKNSIRNLFPELPPSEFPWTGKGCGS